MLDTFVVKKLQLWAEWRLRKADGGLGYPKKSAFERVSPSATFWTPELDGELIDVDKAVSALITERRDVLMQSYTQSGTKEQKAKRCGISIRTYDLRLELAHRDILGLLNDIAAGVDLPNQNKLKPAA